MEGGTSPTSQAARQDYSSIQVLRGFAALAVVVHHALARFDTHVAAFAAGVDVFFVISGFVMVVSTQGRSITPGTFLKRRLQRIVPLYWIALTATLGIIALGVMARPFPPMDQVLKAYAFIFYTDTHLKQAVPFLGVGWTLNYEMLFYLLFAVTMFLGTFRQIVALAVVFAVAVAFRKLVDPNNGFAFRMTSPLPFEFLFGMIIAYSRDKIARVPVVLLIGGLVIGMIVLALDIQSARVIMGGIPSAMIVAALVGTDRRYPWGALKLPVAVGDASYALYLFHGLVVVTVVLFIPRSWIVMGPIITTVLAVLISLAVYRYVEKPIIAYFQPSKRQPKQDDPALSTIVAG